jgi:hypothetical protein
MDQPAGSSPPKSVVKPWNNLAAWLDTFNQAGDAIDLAPVLEHERDEIRRRRRVVSGRVSTGPGSDHAAVDDLAGLALSGGGVRSATFCLGVLQELDRRGVLRVFDYLSTVSGGGFIGGWWSAWLSRPPGPLPRPPFPPAEQIEQARERDYRTGAALDIERGGDMAPPAVTAGPSRSDPVHHLRLFSNYLTPRKGALSGDTWRAAAVITRNLVLTWIVLLPLLVALLAVGQIYFLATPDSAHGVICGPATATAPGCAVVRAQLAKATADKADSARVILARDAGQIQRDRLVYASKLLAVLVGWLVVATIVWLLTGARDLPQLAAVVVGLATAFTLLHAVAERFTPSPPLFHRPGPNPWIILFQIGAAIIVLVGLVVPLVTDSRFLVGRGRDDQRDVRTSLVTRIHASLLAATVGTALVLAIGGFAPDLFDLIFGAGGARGVLATSVARAGGWVAALTAAAGTIATLWSAAPTGGGDGGRGTPPLWHRALIAITPTLALLLLAVLIATALRYGLAHLPPAGHTARTYFFGLVPGILALAFLALLVHWVIGWGKAVAVQRQVALAGVLVALLLSFTGFMLYWRFQPFAQLEPLGTSVLIAVLLCGFFTVFEYLSDESPTPRSTRVGVVLVAAMAATVAGLVSLRFSPLEWVHPTAHLPARTPAAVIAGVTFSLVLARCSVTWATAGPGGAPMLVSRFARLRAFRHPRLMAGVSIAVAIVVAGGIAYELAWMHIPFDAQRQSVAGEAARRFAGFCVAALAFASAFVLADLWFSRTDSPRVLGLQVLATGLLGPTLMQQYLEPMAPSVLFVNANLAFAATAIAIVMGLGWLVDPNTIALHTFYRARLVRAYLGASNTDRTGNVTEAARNDDLPLSTLRNCRQGGPYHLINTTLNLVGGRDLITAQRSAANFVLSALHCGSLRTGFRLTRSYMGNRMTLGTALAISGAAASPNMGSKTPSAALTMWLAFLNVRLGFWAPTPNRSRWRSPQPRLWPFYLLAECLSQTNDLGSYCYLTDGGHFDNTGLYALVERGCRYIVVVDCGADPKPTFSDIGDAIRRCRIDFGAEIEVPVQPFKRDDDGLSQSHCVVGRIRYSRAHAAVLGWDQQADRHGIVVWIKPAVRQKDPADVRQYALENDDFPQQTTGDQWFDEAQFESYRRLGRESVRALLRDVKPQTGPGVSPEKLFQEIEKAYSQA